jgi:hypothetical protein
LAALGIAGRYRVQAETCWIRSPQQPARSTRSPRRSPRSRESDRPRCRLASPAPGRWLARLHRGPAHPWTIRPGIAPLAARVRLPRARARQLACPAPAPGSRLLALASLLAIVGRPNTRANARCLGAISWSRVTPDDLCGLAPSSSSFCQFRPLVLTAIFDRYYSIPIVARKSTGKIVLS